MKTITREEIIALSKIAHIQVYENEIGELAKQLEAVLSYASCLSSVAEKFDGSSMPKQTNIQRDDCIRDSLPKAILAQAPAVEADYFVVPAIIKQNS